MPDSRSQTALTLTAQIVASYVGRNATTTDALPTLIKQTFLALSGIAATGSDAGEAATPAALSPAVPIKRSVFPDYIVCLEDGKKVKMLKRHLSAAFNLTPDQYRQRWGLPSDYPMVAPNYAARRSELAKQIGLGRKADAHAVESDDPKPRGRRKKVA